MDRWRTMHSVPKEENVPLWLSDGFFVRLGCWRKGRWADWSSVEHYWTGGREDLHFVPTLWQPTPRSPKSAMPERYDLGEGWENASIAVFADKIVVAHPDHPPLMIDIVARTIEEIKPVWPTQEAPHG